MVFFCMYEYIISLWLTIWLQNPDMLYFETGYGASVGGLG